MPRSAGHVFHDRLQEVLIGGEDSDRFVEAASQPCLALLRSPSDLRRRADTPHAHGLLFFKEIQAARRCQAVFGFDVIVRISCASRAGTRFPIAGVVEERGRLRMVHDGVRLGVEADRPARPVKGEQIIINASTMKAIPALMVRRDYGRNLWRNADTDGQESSMDTPYGRSGSARPRARARSHVDESRPAKTPTRTAKITKMKDGRTHSPIEPEHAVDLDTSVIVAGVLHPG